MACAGFDVTSVVDPGNVGPAHKATGFMTKPDELAELRETGKRHLEFACSLAELQIEQGGRVLFEYPLAASEEPCLWKLRTTDGVRCVRCDQCQFGMTSVDSEGNVGPPCKATRFHDE